MRLLQGRSFSLIVLIVLLGIALPVHAQTTIQIGETSVLTAADNGNANLLLAQSAALSQTATIQSLSFYVTKAGGNLRLGIYDATGANGGPGALKAQTNSFVPKTGWNTASIVTAVSLNPGTYWLAYLPSSNTLAFEKVLTGSSAYYNFAFAAMPSTFSANHTNATVHWSFYATLVAAPPAPVNGQCGAANGVAVSSKPTTNLCTAGTATTISGAGPWNWLCDGLNGGTNASCSAPVLTVNGQCGSSNGGTFTSAPTSGLCSAGAASAISGAGPWNWSCSGSGGGTNSSCSASVTSANGQCGPANGVAVNNAPTANLCTVGTASTVSGTGPWGWTCSGSGGGTTDTCSAPVAPTNGQCGPANGVGATSAPATGLCTLGPPSTVTGTGPWNWTCGGTNGGTNASCSSPLTTSLTIGQTAQLSMHESGTANLLVAQSAQLPLQATLQSLSFYVTTAAGQLRLGVYDASGTGGGPGNLLAQTGAFTPTTGWNTINVTPVVMNPGNYWLAYFASSNSLGFLVNTSVGSAAYYTTTFGSMPSTYAASFSSGVASWSFYATLAPTGNNIALVDGVCGSVNQTYTNVAPSGDELCSTGTASAVSGNGPWTWTCAGNDGVTAMCAASSPIYPVSASGRHLVDVNGNPFMIVGDAPQDIINIPLTGPASMDFYFSDRLSYGFNSMWIAGLCDNYDSCPADGSTYDGIEPFTGMLSGNGCPAAGKPVCYDMTTPNPAYWNRMDAIIEKAGAYGMLVFFNHISTDGCGSTFWQQAVRNNGLTKANAFGQFLGNRYKNFPNIVWFAGNDFQCWQTASDDALQAAVVQGIESAGDTHLQTDELSYRLSTSKDDTGPLGALMGLNGIYSYYPTYDEALHAYNQAAIPSFLEEANYEFESYGGAGETTPEDLRKQAYWTMLSGGSGQLYGNHWTWSFYAGWNTPANLDTVGAAQITIWKELFASLPWYAMAPDQSNQVLTAGMGNYASSETDTVNNNTYATALYGGTANGTYAVVYVPTVRAVTINMAKFGPSVQVQWFDPTNGLYATVAGSPFGNSGSHSFTPPGNNAEGDSDWVLVLQGQPTP